MKKSLLLLSAALLSISAATAQVTVDFEEFEMEKDQVDNGKNLTTGQGFVSQGFKFVNGNYPEYYSWEGFAISTQTSTAFNSLDDQYNSCVGHGADNSKTYAVFYYCTYFGTGMEITHSENRLFTPQSVKVTNAAYAVSSMTKGDGFAKQFTEDDWFQLYIIGQKGGEVTDTVTVDLAANGMLLFTWKNIDLTSLGEVDRIVLSMNSTDLSGKYMNTPAYCCFDNFVSLVGEVSPVDNIKAPAQRTDIEGLYSQDGTQLAAPQRGINIVRYTDGSTVKFVR